MSGYTIAQLDELIRLAKQLGFWDDVAHWESEKCRITDRTMFIERRIADEPVTPDLSAYPEVQHRIEGGRFVCPGDRGSRCHQYPGCDCESWPCGHGYEVHDECWIKPWIDATDLADSYAGVEFELLLRDEDFPDGDVSWSWEGDYVTFDYVPNRTIGLEQ